MEKSILCIIIVLSFLLCGSSACAVGVELTDEAFRQLDEGFFADSFGGEVGTVAISDTLAFSFAYEEPNGLMPGLFIQSTEGMSIPEAPDEMLTVVLSIIETAQYLQSEFPEVFIFNAALAESYGETGLGFTIAEPELWIWSSTKDGVLLPLYFHEQAEGAMADEVYLLSLTQQSGGNAYYALYANPSYVVEYMKRIPLDASQSQFQVALMVWLVEKYVLDDAQAGQETAQSEEDTMVVVTAEKANIRASADADADLVASVYKNQQLKLLSVADNGWYEVETADGVRGFISPKLAVLL